MWSLNSPSVREQISSYQSGTTRKRISRKNLGKIRLQVPPLAEQRRIVEALEDHLSRLDAAVDYLAAAHSKNDALWQSALDDLITDAATQGSELSIAEVAEVQGGILKNPKRKPTTNKFPFLRVANVPRGSLDLEDVHEVELFDGDLERWRLQAGDLLVVEGNGSPDQIGRAAMWRDEIRDCVHQNHLIRVRPGPRVNGEFLEFIWNSSYVSASIRAAAISTSGLHTLSTRKVKGIRIPVPPLAKQQEYLAAMQEWRTQTNRLAKAISALRHEAVVLRKSLLQAAFTGKLVPRDLTDQPATELLKRIDAERAGQPKAARTRKPAAAKKVLSPPNTTIVPIGIQEEIAL